ncbi:MAG: hypothetical protein HQK67_12570 [Desulfamplus sp.]|nr:hypothetical protein [Desulfamplus sp.]
MWILELENGLPPLAWNELLQKTSEAHNSDMINRKYYSHISPEKLSFHDRIVNSQYDPLFTGESLGMLSFNLYVDPIKAVEGIFENMIRDELNPDLNYARNIFNKEFTEIGISFMSTTFSLSRDSILNAYLVIADFAKPVQNRNYILGNIYNLGENQPESLLLSEKTIPEKEYAKKLLFNKGWAPEKSYDNFVLWVNNLTEGWSVQVSPGYLGTYQIQIPANTFYSIDLYSNNQTTPSNRVVNIGTGVNKMVDFGLNQINY